jgi:hypothetical protein
MVTLLYSSHWGANEIREGTTQLSSTPSSRRQFLKVFLGSPYEKRYRLNEILACLKKLPIRLVLAKDVLRQDHLLANVKYFIGWADLCLFDVSYWNPNVTLETGLAEAMGARYVVLANRKHKKGVPSDLKGRQRIEYSSYTREVADEENDLLDQLVTYFMKTDSVIGPIQTSLPAGRDRKRRYLFALRVLAELREHNSLEVKRLSKYTNLGPKERDVVLSVLARRRFVRSEEKAKKFKDAKRIRLADRRIYPPQPRPS